MLFKDLYDQVTSPRRGGPRFVEEGKKAWAKTLTLDPRSTARIAADALIDMLAWPLQQTPVLSSAVTGRP